MFLQKYVQEVDEQLARLIAARDTIAALVGPSSQVSLDARLSSALVADETKSEPVALEAVAVEAPDVVELPAKRRGRPKGSRNKTTMIRSRRSAAPEPRALTSAVPTGPVVVSPAQLAKRQEAVVPKPEAPFPKTEQPGGGLDALIRELTERRVTAFSPAA